jgi:hypothetical protein
MIINESQQKRLNEAKAEPNPQNRMIRMAVFICENCSDEVKQKICDYMESQIAECLESKEK